MQPSFVRNFGNGKDASGTRWVLWLYFFFLLLCFLGGGGSRFDIVSLLYLRPAAILCAAAFLLFAPRVEFRAVKIPLLLLTALAAIMLLQLIPLPPEIWTRLPGRAPFLEAASVAQISQPWRPVSIVPDLTLNSLASLVVPFAALIGFAALSAEQRSKLLGFLIMAAAVSALLGIAQRAGGESSPLYLYRITNSESAVGLFSNRNHQAALLATAYPMLAVWAALASQDPQIRRFRAALGVAFGLLLVLLILVTGSRAGLFLAAAAAPMAGFLYMWLDGGRRGRGAISWKNAAYVAAGVLLVGALLVFLASSSAVAVQRLLDLGVEDDMRLANLPVISRVAWEMFPVGSGFGTFDPVFRVHEPASSLSLGYLNQAHNDLLELILTGGLAGVLVLAAFLIWFCVRATAVFRRRGALSREAAMAQLGVVLILLLLVASLVDYPLRTPVMAVLFAIACGWLSVGGDTVKRAADTESRGEPKDMESTVGLAHRHGRAAETKAANR